MDVKCENCKFVATYNGISYCRRHAPREFDFLSTPPLDDQNMYVFGKITLTTDWCGEFEPALPS